MKLFYEPFYVNTHDALQLRFALPGNGGEVMQSLKYPLMFNALRIENSFWASPFFPSDTLGPCSFLGTCTDLAQYKFHCFCMTEGRSLKKTYESTLLTGRKEVPYAWALKYNYVHMRGLHSFLSSWQPIVRSCMSVSKQNRHSEICSPQGMKPDKHLKSISIDRLLGLSAQMCTASLHEKLFICINGNANKMIKPLWALLIR